MNAEEKRSPAISTPVPGGGPSQETVPGKSGSQYLPTLDGWRAIAIVLVILSHVAKSFLPPPGTPGGPVSLQIINQAGLLGVRIFFGLSGFLITSRLIDEEARRGRISLKTFYIRRIFRIIPAAFFFLCFAGALAIGGLIPITVGRWLSALLCFANYSKATASWYLGHFWSLSVEEHFYLLWPGAFLLLGAFRLRFKAAVTLALLIAFWRMMDFKFHLTGEYRPRQFWGRTDIAADGLIWGCAFALLVGDPGSRSRLHPWVTSGPIWAACVFISFFLGLCPLSGWKSYFLLTVQAVAIPLMIVGRVLAPGQMAGRFLESPPLRWCGRLSYSLYLWQQLFFAGPLDRIPEWKTFQSLPLNVVALLGFAMISHYLIEKPLIRVGHRLAEHRT